MPKSNKNWLVRQSSEDFRPKHVVVVGNGVVEGGWDVLNYLSQSNVGKELKLTTIATMHRWLKTSLFGWLRRKKIEAFEVTIAKELLSEMQQLSAAFHCAERDRKIFLKRDFLNFLDREMESAPGSLAIVTTNWDSLLWNLPVHNLVQLHGRVDHPTARMLILPTMMPGEVKAQPVESLNKDEFLSVVKGMNDAKFVKAATFLYGSCFDLNDCPDAYLTAMRWLDSAKKISLYGTACNTYDAELNVLLWRAGQIGSPKIAVYNTNPLVVERMAAIFDKTKLTAQQANVWTSS